MERTYITSNGHEYTLDDIETTMDVHGFAHQDEAIEFLNRKYYIANVRTKLFGKREHKCKNNCAHCTCKKMK